ncbi:MAG: flagellar filament capping protein FliD [Nitrospinae bacterium]|nr:flagellar filament capping protein FliD [Nitrospinota bacterium]
MSISIDGLVSGTNYTSLIQQLIDIERQPIKLIENKQTILKEEKTAWSAISPKLVSLESAANDLKSAQKFSSLSASFQNNNSAGGSVLSVTATTSAAAGTYNVKVTQLAANQISASSQTFASMTTAAGLSGTLSIGATNVSITSGQSLSDILSNINNSAAAATATIVNSGTTASPLYKLVLSGDDTGAAGAFTASTVMDAGALSFTTTQSAQNALFTVNGISISKDTNTATDVISGVTLNLQTSGSGAVTVATDYAGIVTKVEKFVAAYNDALNLISNELKYDPSTKSKGALFGNNALMTIQNQLRSIVSGAVPGLDPTDTSTLSTLSQVGIMMDRNFQLTVDTAELSSALQTNFAQVQNLFAPSGSGTYTFVAASGKTQGGTYSTRVSGGVFQMKLSGTSDWISLTQDGNFALGQAGTSLEGLLIRTGSLVESATGQMKITVGVAERVATNASTYTEYSAEGLIYTQTKSIDDRDREYQDNIDALNVRITKKEVDLKAKFANLEVLLAKMSSQQQYLNNQLTNLNKNWR